MFCGINFNDILILPVRDIMGKKKKSKEVTRREFLKYSGMIGGAILLQSPSVFTFPQPKSRVALVNTDNRRIGVSTSINIISTSFISE